MADLVGSRGGADVGIGVHRFRDPALVEEFATEPLAIDVAEFHTYGVDWSPGSLEFRVDGEIVRRLDQAPDYPVQLMLGVFDFRRSGCAGPRARRLARPGPPARVTPRPAGLRRLR